MNVAGQFGPVSHLTLSDADATSSRPTSIENVNVDTLQMSYHVQLC